MSNLNGKQFASIYRGLHVPLSAGPDTSDDEILSKVDRRPGNQVRGDEERQRFEEDPDIVDRWPVYGNNWTTEERTAKTFALRRGHNMGYSRISNDRERTGVMLEAHTTVPAKRNDLMQGYGEAQVDWPGRSNITGFTAHVVHDVGLAAKPRYTAEQYGSRRAAIDAFDNDRERIVRSFPVPEDHWKPEWAR